MNPFEILEIAPDATPEEIKAAYHRLAKKWHPDRFTGSEKAEAENRFRMLADAFNMLKDPSRRAEVNARAAQAASQQATQAREASKPVAERSVEDWFADAKTAMAEKDYSRAMGLIQYTIRLDANRAEAYSLMAQLLEATGGDKRTLVKALESAVRLNPKDIESMMRLSELFHELGMQAKASRLREEARKAAPNHKMFRQAAPQGKPAAAPAEGLLGQIKGLVGRFTKKG